ncbi:8-amino-7-oxononanoate synthase [Pseudoxanthomonas sp. UTMC 1351]|uniref:8-amino-7-oxononanoate synthase n=1 Tax=Pseudoxanthomonas sp. UTMC 1351 TaxID=2695853 RepID=UPI0034CE078C
MTRLDLLERVQAQRQQRIAQGRQRVRRVITRRDGVRVEVAGRWLIEFASNDYLGLAQQFEVVSALQDTAAREGVGAGASHLITGHHAAHEALEREVAEWLGYPRGLLFGSGYMANLAVQQALLEDGDVCVQDRLNHASLLDATRLAGCKLRRYPHLDPEGALRQLKQAPEGAAMLVTDGVFSMDGDVAPLRALSLVARMQQALFYVDDAHGVGLRGPDGRGSVAEARMGVTDVPLQLVTLGKALGGYGAVVVGDDALIQHLAETARPYIFTTALPAAQAAATRVAVKYARRDHWRREKLQGLIDRFRTAAQRKGLQLMASESPIQPVLCGADSTAMALSAALESAGYLIPAIRPPTVPEGKARLRVTLSALHSPQDVDGMVETMARSWEAVQRVHGAAAVA